MFVLLTHITPCLFFHRTTGNRPLARGSRPSPPMAHRGMAKPQQMAIVPPKVKFSSNSQWWYTTHSDIPQCLEVRTLISVYPQQQQQSILQSYITTICAGVSGLYEVVSSGDSIDQPTNFEFRCNLPSNISWIVCKNDTASFRSRMQSGDHNLASTLAQPHQQQNSRERWVPKRS